MWGLGISYQGVLTGLLFTFPEVGLVTCFREEGISTLLLREKDLAACILGSQVEKKTAAMQRLVYKHLLVPPFKYSTLMPN